MPLISDETILEVQRAIDIYEVVSGYVPLRRSGANYKGLCPFHEEKSPSFMVHPERQIFKCFGCQKGGNAFGFVMAYEKVDFPEAVRLLADRAGIPVRYRDGGEGPDRTDLYRIHEWAAKHFQRILKTNPAAEAARSYARKRGLTEESIEKWGIGYALDSWDDLLVQARRNGFSDATIQSSGLANRRDSGGLYDRFRGRLVFPIRDPRGRVIAFGGRILGEGEPKYLNSPETPLFSKGRTLYGLDVAKESAEETRTLHIVEGYFDVVLPDQAGVKGFVATLGTALTRDHLSILRRYAARVVLVFDSDAAGIRAAERGLDLLLGENLDLYVARLEGGKDPADVVVSEGADRLRGQLGTPVEIFRFLVDTLEARLGGGTPSSRTRIVEEMADRIAQVPDEIKREVLIQQLSSRYGIPERTIRGRISRPEAVPSLPAPASEPAEPAERVGRELLELFLLGGELQKRIRERMTPERFPTEGTRRIAETMWAQADREGGINAGEVASLMQDAESMSVVADILSRGTPAPEEAERRLAGCFEYLESAEYREKAGAWRAGLAGSPPEEVDLRLRLLQSARGLRNSRGIPRA